MSPTATHQDHPALFVGAETTVPLLDGSQTRYVNLDNAASTPPLKSVQTAVNHFLDYYSSVHRGTGYKSQLSTHLYEQSRQIVFRFLDADPTQHTCIFGKNTTEAINKLAHRFPFTKQRNVILTSGMEHHSNDLPWRAANKTVHVNLTQQGALDEDDFDDKLERFSRQVALVAITGGSNVTGYLNPIHRLAEKAHAHGAQILVDCAQLAPHRKIEMGSLDDPDHLDYVAVSGHKMYAPFGTGALVGRRDTFERGDPDQTGGGTVEIVTLDSVAWADPPERDEAGSPNTVGAIAMATAMLQLESIGMQAVAEHEANLTAHALQNLASVPGIKIYGDTDTETAMERLGVIPFQMENASHFLVAAILGHEFGIGVRSGCFCAHPYILHLLDLSPMEADRVRQRMLAGDKREMPGLVRASFGLFNSLEDVDKLTQALHHIARGDYQGRYHQDPASGEYAPQGWQPDFENFYNFDEFLG